MENENKIKKNSAIFFSSQKKPIINNNKSQQEFNFNEQEKIMKNLEPKDNTKRTRKLMNSENQIMLDSEIKINEKRKLYKNHLFEKGDIKSLSELNSNKTFGFFHREKENIQKRTDNSIQNKNIEYISDNNKKENINNKIEFHDNKFIHLKKRKKLNLLLNNIIESNDFDGGVSGNNIIINNSVNDFNKNYYHENKFINMKTELIGEKQPLDNMRNRNKKQETKNEKDNKVNKSADEKMSKNDIIEDEKEKIKENKIIKINILDRKLELNDVNLSRQDDSDGVVNNNNVYEKIISKTNNEEKNKILNIVNKNTTNINNDSINDIYPVENNAQKVIDNNDIIAKNDNKNINNENQETSKKIIDTDNKITLEEIEENKIIKEIENIQENKLNLNINTNQDEKIIYDEEKNINNDKNQEQDTEKENEIKIVAKQINDIEEQEEKLNNNENQIQLINDNNKINNDLNLIKNEKEEAEYNSINKEDIEKYNDNIDEDEKRRNNDVNDSLKNEKMNMIKDAEENEYNKKDVNVLNNLEEEQKPNTEETQKEFQTKNEDNKEEILEDTIKKEIKNEIELVNENCVEELNKNILEENINKEQEENKFVQDNHSDIDILDFNDINQSLNPKIIKEMNRNIEKNKIITDVYNIKIDIEHPIESTNSNNDDIKEKSNKSEKLIESVSKEESDVNKENIQDNGQISELKTENYINNKVIKEIIEKNVLEDNKIIVHDIKINEERNEVNLQNFNLETKEKQEDINIKKEINPVEHNLNTRDILIDNTIREFEIIKKSSEDKITNEKKYETDKNIKKISKNIIKEKENDNNKAGITKIVSTSKILAKKELKTKPINKKGKNIKLNKDPELKRKNIFSKIKDRKEFNKSEDKRKKNVKRISPIQNKILKYEKPTEKNINKEKKKQLLKEKLSPISNRTKHIINYDKKSKPVFKTIETNDKLNEIKKKKKFEIKEKRLKTKSNLRLNYELNPITKLFKTELSFKNAYEKLLFHETKVEKKSYKNKSNIISIDKMKNANKIIKSKKKIEKILNYSSNNLNNKKSFNSNTFNSNKNKTLKRTKETKENKNKKSGLRNLILSSKDINISNNNKSNDSLEESDLGDVGEIIEDDSEFEIELNDLGENIFINNPKSIITYSSEILMSKNEKKRLSLSLNKLEKSIDFKYISKSPMKNIALKTTNERNKYNKLESSKMLYEKIKKKENDIQRIKKLIEIVKRNIKYYDKENKEIENFIRHEEQLSNEYQMLINFLNLK